MRRYDPSNPWRQHPLLREFSGIPENALPPAWHPVVLGNPYELEKPRTVKHTGYALTPTPPLSKPKKGADLTTIPPEDAVDAVYLYLMRQARLRSDRTRAHIETGGVACRRVHSSKSEPCDKFANKAPDMCPHGEPTVPEMSAEFDTLHWQPKFWLCQAWRVVREGGVLRAPDVSKFEVFSPATIPIPSGAFYFASGSEDSPGSITGLGTVRPRKLGVGVTVSKCRLDSQCILAVCQLPPPARVFVDSGAFSEVVVQGGKLVAPASRRIDHKGWLERIEAYSLIANCLGDRAYVVAPDRVGSQSETLARAKKYAKVLQAGPVRDRARILVPVQRGPERAATFYAKMKKALGVREPQAIPAFPMKKGAYSLAELVEFVKKARPHAIHLLGVGPKGSVRESPKGESIPSSKALERIRRAAPDTFIFMDSGLIKGGAGRGYLSVDPDVYTWAQDIVRYQLMSEAFQKSFVGGELMETWIRNHGWREALVPDYTDNVIMEINDWLPRQYRGALYSFVDSVYRLPKGTKNRILKDPYEWYQEFEGWKYPDVEGWIDRRWAQFLAACLSANVKRLAILEAWGTRDTRGMKAQLGTGAEQVIDRIQRSWLAQATPPSRGRLRRAFA